MASTKEIQRRIKSVSSTKKITKAMEMVAASKTRRSIEEVLRTRTYANLSWATVLNLSQARNGEHQRLHPLLSRRKKIEKVAIILIASNGGLCGGYNSAIMNAAHQSILKHPIDTDFIVLGKKGRAINKYYSYNIVAEFPKADIVDQVAEIIPVATMVINDYLNKKYDKILLAYTDFVSATKQEPRVKQLLPIDIKTKDKYLGVVGKDSRLGTDRDFIQGKQDKHLSDAQYTYEYTFEPSPATVLNDMLPRLIEVQLYQALLESNASEHSARMAAMHQATEAANDMVNELVLYYNKARQASITNEIAEISAGANALK